MEDGPDLPEAIELPDPDLSKSEDRTLFAYKIVPFRGSVDDRLSPNEVAKQFAMVINSFAADGWEFHQVAAVTTTVRPGCLGGLMGLGATNVVHDYIVFRRRRLTTG